MMNQLGVQLEDTKEGMEHKRDIREAQIHAHMTNTLGTNPLQKILLRFFGIGTLQTKLIEKFAAVIGIDEPYQNMTFTRGKVVCGWCGAKPEESHQRECANFVIYLMNTFRHHMRNELKKI